MLKWWEIQRSFVRFGSNFKKLWEDLSYDVPRAFKEVFWYFPKHLCRFISKAVQYMPLLYKDEDWDWAYLLDMMDYKIGRMRKCIHNNGIIADADKVCNQMALAQKLIEEIRKDDWTPNEDQEHDATWGPSHIKSILVPGSMSSECRFLRLNVRTKDDEVQERREYRKIMFLGWRRQKTTWHKLFKLLEDNLRCWWD